MDPISIITVVQWTAQSAIALHDFITTIQNASEALLLSREAHALYAALRSLSSALQNPDIVAYVKRNAALREDLMALGEPLRLCDRRVGELMRKLDDCTELKGDGKRSVRSLKWYFVKGDVLAARVYLADVRDTVTFALTGSHFLETLRTNAAAASGNSAAGAESGEKGNGNGGGLVVPKPVEGVSRTPTPVLEEQIRDLQKQGQQLRRAARDGDNRAVELLLDAGVPVDSKSFEGRTALSHAAEHGNVDTVKFLLRRKANVDCSQNVVEGNRHKRAESKRTPLHWAATGGYNEVCGLLLDASANMDARSASQRTPVQEAGQAGHLATISYLLDRGADVNTRTYYGWTLLHSAASNGRVDLAELLLKRGADTEAVYTGTWHGEGKGDGGAKEQRPLHYAVRPNRWPIGDDQAMIDLLCKSGANISSSDSKGSTPLHYAVRSRSKTAVEVLLRYARMRDIRVCDDADNKALDDARHLDNNSEIANMIRARKDELRSNHGSTKPK